ncbi:tRNA (adenosine(37)-N6)-threonylcarbamoyltransferase complex ATPase subunit type 1 TsaE [bacterium]|nr:tRNA (adenosine(37)-N6)-threonylcarbamoyltransferase complex ATPase subunit type 1 TsaE [bacterium]
MSKIEIISRTLDDTWRLATNFAKCIDKNGVVVFFLGEIGAGKTTFIKKFLAEYGVEEEVTSPSFVVMNEYHSAQLPVYHFDFYRLENLGTKTIRDELTQYSDEGNILLIEWAEFNDLDIFDDKITFNIEYIENDYRKIVIEANGKNSQKVVDELKKYENS